MEIIKIPEHPITLITAAQYFFHVNLECISMYEWTCSPYDSANDKYYLPYFGETSEIFQFTWQPSTGGTTYVYPINSNQLNCTGLVTALEFCYTTTIAPIDNSARDAFNFLLLNRQTGNRFEVVKSILVRATPSQATCMNSNPRQCCEIMAFNDQNQFSIHSSNLAIGFSPQRDSHIHHQGLFTGLYLLYTASTHITSVSLNSETTANLKAPVDRSLRLAWLHISEL